MQPTDKRIATVEQWQALKGVIDGNIGKARVLTEDDYNWPVDNPTYVSAHLLEPGFYTSSGVMIVIAGSYYSSGTFLVSGTQNGYKKVVLFGGASGSLSGMVFTVWTLQVSDGAVINKQFVNLIEDSLTSTRTDGSLSAKQGRVLKGLIDTEVSDRQAADANLQTQIDAISAGSDVTDIVGTKADLNNYDTSALGNNDIIKVLADESEGGATTYYRWSTTTSTFTLIGEEGPYYTKTQADTLLAGKQDTLTAGANITISNNTISATDTTYTAGTGIDITNGVISTTGGGGPTVVQTTGTSTTDVMSQNATTSMVYADPSTKNKVQIGNGAFAQGIYSLAIGNDAIGRAQNSIAIGIGASTGFTLVGEMAIGASASATGQHSVALGTLASASGKGSLAVGGFSSATVQGQFDISSSNSAFGYNSSNYRLLSGVYDPQGDHDAATKGYVDTAVASAGGAAEINSTDWSALWQ